MPTNIVDHVVLIVFYACILYGFSLLAAYSFDLQIFLPAKYLDPEWMKQVLLSIVENIPECRYNTLNRSDYVCVSVFIVSSNIYIQYVNAVVTLLIYMSVWDPLFKYCMIWVFKLLILPFLSLLRIQCYIRWICRLLHTIEKASVRLIQCDFCLCMLDHF